MLTGLVPPPTDAVMPKTAQVFVCTVMGALCSASFVAALAAWRKTRSPLYILLWIGGAFAVLNEPPGDILARAWHPGIGELRTFMTFERPISLWIILCYPAFFGALPSLLLWRFRKGVTRRGFWAAFGALILADLLIEPILIKYSVEIYYGYQPLKILGLPWAWPIMNALGVMLIAVPLAVFPNFFSGRRLALLPLFPPIAQFAAWGVGIPFLSVLNTDLSTPWHVVTELLTMVIGLTAVNLLSQLYFAHRPSASPVRTLPQGPAIRTDPDVRSLSHALDARLAVSPVTTSLEEK